MRLISVALATPKSMTLGVGRPSTSPVTSTLLGFQVAVDDPLLVGVLHRLADGSTNNSRRSPDREPQSGVTVLGDRLAAHQFHNEERLAGRGRAAVVEARAMLGWSIKASALPLGVGNRASTAR